MQIRPLTETIAAEILGVDIREIDDEAFRTIYRAFLDSSMVVIRDQSLSIPQFLAFGARFGALRPHINRNKNHPEHPELMELDNKATEGRPADLAVVSRALEWHSDLGYEQVPAKATGLYGIQLPSSGGNTQYNSMYAAYEALPDDLRRAVHGRRAWFNWGGKDASKREELSPGERDRKPVLHDLVLTHPETGRRALFPSPAQIVGIDGMAERESDEILRALFELTNKPDVDYSHAWRKGDVVIWDNRCLLHAATLDYPLHERRLHWRITIMDDGKARH